MESVLRAFESAKQSRVEFIERVSKPMCDWTAAESAEWDALTLAEHNAREVAAPYLQAQSAQAPDTRWGEEVELAIALEML